MKSKKRKAKPKPRRVVLGVGSPGDVLWDRRTLFYLTIPPSLRAKKVRIVAEVLS